MCSSTRKFNLKLSFHRDRIPIRDMLFMHISCFSQIGCWDDHGSPKTSRVRWWNKSSFSRLISQKRLTKGSHYSPETDCRLISNHLEDCSSTNLSISQKQKVLQKKLSNFPKFSPIKTGWVDQNGILASKQKATFKRINGTQKKSGKKNVYNSSASSF